MNFWYKGNIIHLEMNNAEHNDEFSAELTSTAFDQNGTLE